MATCLLIATAVTPGCSSSDTPQIVAPTTPTTSGETTSTVPTDTGADPALWPPTVRLEQRWDGFKQPLLLTHSGDGSGRLYVVEQGGMIRVIENGKVLAEPFLDMRGNVSTGGERGLLGLAFAPDFKASGVFYINYTDKAGNTQVERRWTPTGPSRRHPANMETVITIEQPYANHNGGNLAFGPDGYLYIGMGDGGSGGDPKGNGQNTDTLLGKMLRIDVADTGTYTIPGDNPFVGKKGHRPEIWALGMRNPWRFSFDSATGDLYIADVGQDAWEEVDFQPASSNGGENYGWNRFEGAHAYPPDSNPPDDAAAYALPVAEYGRAVGQSITGGFVYRGTAIKALRGVYVYADYATGTIWGLARMGGVWRTEQLVDTDMSIASFGQDASGEIYVLDISAGTISVLTP